MSRLLEGVVLATLLYGSAQASTDGETAYERGDYTTAFREFLPLAQEGNHVAQYNLGVMYVQGQGVPRDFAEARKWFRKSADQGFAEAQNNLGFMYYSGHGVPINYAEAMKWYRKAAEQGFVLAQIRLGSMYGDGTGVPMNHAEAVKWWRLAAERGNSAHAQDLLGIAYTFGMGVPVDHAEAADPQNRVSSMPRSFSALSTLPAVVPRKTMYRHTSGGGWPPSATRRARRGTT